MNKLTFLVFALAITCTLGQDCTNPLGAEFSFITLEATAAAVTGNTVCKSYDTGANSCCLVAILNGFSSEADDLTTALETAAGDRDEAILAARKVVADLRTNFTTLIASYAAAEDNIDTLIAAAPANLDDIQAVKDFADDYFAEAASFFEDYDTLRTGFDTYQTNRQTCFVALIEAQVAAWCLGCNQNHASLGVGAGPTVDYATAFEDDLRDACYPYIASSAQQGQILRLAYYTDAIADMNTALGKIASATAATQTEGIDDFNTAIASPVTTEQASSIPSNCDADACTWIEDTLFANGQLDRDAAILGGEEVTSRRRFLSQNRLLQTWTPAADEAKITIAFPANPANVVNVNDLSALRVGVFSCIIAFFVALLI
jgi:hypothetical protein